MGNREWFELWHLAIAFHTSRLLVGAIPYTIYSPDGQLLVTTIFGKGVEIREAQTGKLVRQLRCHLGHVRDMAFDGLVTRLVTCGHDGRAMLWDVTENDRYPTRISMQGRVNAMVCSPTEDEFALIVLENPSRGFRSSGEPEHRIAEFRESQASSYREAPIGCQLFGLCTRRSIFVGWLE